MSQPVNVEEYMRSIVRAAGMRVSLVVFLAGLSCVVTYYGQAQSGTKTPLTSAAMAFDSPQQGADALISAAESYDVSKLLEIFGPDGKDFVASSDPTRDKSFAADFAAKAREKLLVTIDPKSKAQAVLTVGNDDWPLPVPIVKKGSKWYFDSKQGREEILFRRIGANELRCYPNLSRLRRCAEGICLRRFTTILESTNTRKDHQHSR